MTAGRWDGRHGVSSWAVTAVVVVMVCLASCSRCSGGADDSHAEHRKVLDVGGCSREGSRLVRGVLAQHVFPVLTGERYRFPLSLLGPSCPLRPDLGLYEAHETSKDREDESYWRCSLCGKAFSSEHFLDVHLARYHGDALDLQATACLADFADVLHTPELADTSSPIVTFDNSPTGVYSTACASDAALGARVAACRRLARQCFAPTGRAIEQHAGVSAAPGRAAAFASAASAFRSEFEAVYCDGIARVCADGLGGGRTRVGPATGIDTAPLPWWLPSLRTVFSLAIMIGVAYTAIAMGCARLSAYTPSTGLAGTGGAPSSATGRPTWFGSAMAALGIHGGGGGGGGGKIKRA